MFDILFQFTHPSCSNVLALVVYNLVFGHERTYGRMSLFSHTYMGDNIVKQVLHYTLFYKTGHLKMDPNLWTRGGQKIGQA